MKYPVLSTSIEHFEASVKMFKNMLKGYISKCENYRWENREDSDTEEERSEAASAVCIFQSIWEICKVNSVLFQVGLTKWLFNVALQTLSWVRICHQKPCWGWEYVIKRNHLSFICLSINQVKIRSCVGYQETINDEYILWLCIWMMNKIYKGKCDNWWK